MTFCLFTSCFQVFLWVLKKVFKFTNGINYCFNLQSSFLIMNSYSGVLSNLIKYYYRGYLNYSLEDEEIKTLDWFEQNIFLEATIRSKLLTKYPMSPEFSKLFFKKLINYLEPCQEIHDDLYSFLCNTMNNDVSRETYCYRHYIFDEDLTKIITMKETKNMVVNGTTGMKTWEASLMLADWAICNKSLLENKVIFELGSGIGFAGITITQFCNPKSVTMTDCHDDVLKGICENVEINFTELNKQEIKNQVNYHNDGIDIKVMSLDWNNIEELPENVIPDVIIGADIVYDPSVLDILCLTVKNLLIKNKHADVYFASVIRNMSTFDSFLATLGVYGLMFTKMCFESCVHLQWDDRINICLIKINEK